MDRAKNWCILAERFRCRLDIHLVVSRTIYSLVNLQTQIIATSWRQRNFSAR